MARVNGIPGFTQLTKLNVIEDFRVNGQTISEIINTLDPSRPPGPSDLDTAAVQAIVGQMFMGNVEENIDFVVTYDATNQKINFRGSDQFQLPIVTDLVMTNIPTRINVGTDVNGPQPFSYVLQHFSSLASLNLTLNGEVIRSMSFPSQDGPQADSATLSGIDTSTETTLNFQIQGTANDGLNTPFSSAIYAVEVRNLADQERLYYSLNDPGFNAATVDVSTLSSIESDTGDHTFSVGPSTADQTFDILAPSDHDITAITYTTGGIETPELAGFDRTPNIRTIGGVQYHHYQRGPLTTGFTANVRLTLA